MITENGIVTKIDAGTAWVKTIRRSACEGCGSRESCEAAKTGEVEAVNIVGAGLGDTVTVGVESGTMIKISMLLYIFPVLCMIGGAVLGTVLAPRTGMEESAAAALFAFGSFFISFICIRLTGRSMSGNSRYQAKVIKIQGRGAAALEQASSMPCRQP